MRFQKQKLSKYIFIVVMSYSSSVLSNDPIVPPETSNLIPPSSDGIWYYEIGGADSLILPSYNKARFKFKTGLDWGGNLTCSDLDPDISIQNALNGLKQGWATLQRNVVNSVKGTIASLPALALNHVNPGLYDLLNSGLLAAEDQFQIEVASCQKITSDLMSSKPNYEWVKASGYEKYRDFFMGKKSGTSGTGASTTPEAKKADAGAVVKSMEKDAGKEGVNWICGDKRGGVGQKPIVMSEVVWAGYNRLIGRGECETFAPVDSDINPEFVKYWKKPKDAQAWLVDVFGEIEINTAPKKEPKNFKVAAGLMTKIEEVAKDISDDLVSIVDSYRNDKVEPSLKDLQSVSAPGTLVSRSIIIALANNSSVDSNIFINRLAIDMATQREILKASAMRRILYSASMTSEIAGLEPALNIVESWEKRLEREIRYVREEMELRRFLNKSTIPTILEAEYKNNREALR